MAADVLSVIQDVLNQDKQQKREHAKVMREVQKKLNDKEVSEEEGDKEEYTAFVNKTLKKYGVKSPAELSPEDKKRFYNELDAGWEADDEKPEPEDKEEEADLKTRVKDRMKAEQEDDEDDLENNNNLVIDVDDMSPLSLHSPLPPPSPSPLSLHSQFSQFSKLYDEAQDEKKVAL
mgnify:CR=1 FL=1